jgi:peptide/nickel transport system ATP-binding protein
MIAAAPGAPVLQPKAATSPGAGKLLEAVGVSKSYWRRGTLLQGRIENRALDQVSLDLAPGEILGLVGESGCGKSTFAKVLLGLETADAGSLDVGKVRIFEPHRRTIPAAQRGIQMVFQDPYGSLNPRMMVRDLLSEGLRIRGGLSRDRRRGATTSGAGRAEHGCADQISTSVQRRPAAAALHRARHHREAESADRRRSGLIA